MKHPLGIFPFRRDKPNQGTVNLISPPFLVQQPKEPSVQVVEDLSATWYAHLYVENVIRKALGDSAKYVGIKAFVRSHRHTLHHFDTVGVKHSSDCTICGRVRANASLVEDFKILRTVTQFGQRLVRLFPNRVLTAEVLQFQEAELLDVVDVFLGQLRFSGAHDQHSLKKIK